MKYAYAIQAAPMLATTMTTRRQRRTFFEGAGSRRIRRLTAITSITPAVMYTAPKSDRKMSSRTNSATVASYLRVGSTDCQLSPKVGLTCAFVRSELGLARSHARFQSDHCVLIKGGKLTGRSRVCLHLVRRTATDDRCAHARQR